MSPRLIAASHRRTRLGYTLCLSPPSSKLLLAKSWARIARKGLGQRFTSFQLAQRVTSPIQGLASQDKAWVYSLPLSTWLSVSPRRVAGTLRRARVWSMFCLSPPGSACLLAETQIPTADQGFVSLHQAQPLSGSQPATSFWFTHCLSPPDSLSSLAESRAHTARQGLGLRFAFLHQAQRGSSPSRRLATRDKSWVYVLPFSSRLSVSLCRVAGSHRGTKPGSTHCLSPPASAYLLAELRDCTAGQGLCLRFAYIHQAQRESSPSRRLDPAGQGLGLCFASLHHAQRVFLPCRVIALQEKV